MSEKTLGEARVRTDFNTTKSGEVDEITIKSAQLINLSTEIGRKYNSKIEDLRKLHKDLPVDSPEWKTIFEMEQNGRGEVWRLVAVAQTAYEEAAMWAVKAATF